MEDVKTKICTKCGIEKELSEFSNRKGVKCVKKQSHCKKCYSEYKKLYSVKNKEKINLYNTEYNNSHKKEISDYHKKYGEKNKEKLRIKAKNYYIKNKENLKEKNRRTYLLMSEETKEKRRIYSLKFIGERSKNLTYASKLTIEEDPIEGENGELLVRCAHCREYFNPTNGAIRERVRALLGLVRGEHRSYCSDQCKTDCDIYNAQSVPKSLRNVSRQSRCNQKTARKILLQLQIDEFGYNFCDKCGREFKSSNLIIHHNIPVSDDLSEAENIAHYMLVCKDHHEHKGCLGRKY